MAREFKLPDLGEGVSEGQVMRLLVAEGDEVQEDQPIMEVETDKAAVEIPSPYAGTIAKWHVEEKQTVAVGEVMVSFGEIGAPGTSGKTETATAKRAKDAGKDEPGGGTAVAAPPQRQRPSRGRHKPASPAVRKLAKKYGLDLDAVDGSGPGGRVLRRDVEQAAAAPTTQTAAQPSGAPAAPRAPEPPRVAAPPSAPPPSQPVQPMAAVDPPGRDDEDQWGPVKRDPISQTRKTIASVMSHSASLIPHVTDCDDADVTDLEHLRKGYNESIAAEHKLGTLPFVIRAVVRGLQQHPILNASFDEKTGEIVYKRYYNIAVGVQTEQGLVAPVLRDVDRMSIPQINYELAVMIDKARRRKFTIDDTRGGTYTISNAGAMGGSRYSTPIITHPQVAVLAVGRTRWQPWVVDGEVVPRFIMPFSHSMDHRIIDGAQEMAFMRQVIGDLEHPARLML